MSLIDIVHLGVLGADWIALDITGLDREIHLAGLVVVPSGQGGAASSWQGAKGVLAYLVHRLEIRI